MAHSCKSSSSKKNPESSNNSSVSHSRSGISVQQPSFESQNPFDVLSDLNEGESYDNGKPKPLQSSSNDNGKPKSQQSSSSDNRKPESLQSSSNDNRRPKSLQSSSNNSGLPKSLHSSSYNSGSPKTLRSSSTSIKSPKRSPKKCFRNQHRTTPDSPSRSLPMSDQTRKWPKHNETRNTGRANHQSSMAISGQDKVALEKLMAETGGCYTGLCEACYDSTPPIMCIKSAISPHCSSLQKHPWELNKVLVHILDMKEGKVRYLKIRPLPRYGSKTSPKLCQVMDEQSRCIQGNSCRRAHNKVELKLWKYQVEHRINSYKIAHFCCTTNGHLSTVPKLLQKLCSADSGNKQSTSNQMISYYESKESWCYVRPRPLSLPLAVLPVLCKYGDECRDWQADSCPHPHCLEEVELWMYMARNKFRTLNDVVSASKSPPPSSSSPQPLVSKEVFQILPYYCHYCRKQFPNLETLGQHLQTLEHRSSVNSDKEKADDWRYREPPLNVITGGFNGCKVLQEGGVCFLGESSCTDAHSSEELAEWKKRWEYRMMKRRTAKEQGLYPLTENDLLEMQNAGQHMMTTSLPTGVTMECSEEELTKVLEVTGASKETCTFKFDITATKKNPLKKVCLLRDDHRKYFCVPNPKDHRVKLQECPGNFLILIAQDATASARYCVSIEFESSGIGSFNQLVMFDFGRRPMVVREIRVDVGSKALQMSKKQDEVLPVSALKNNCTVVKFTDELKTEQQTFDEKILEKYKAPTLLSRDHGCLEPLSRDNYKQVMHQALYLEEHEYDKRISRFTTPGTLKVSGQAVLQDCTQYAQDGHLFASVSLKQALIDDTVASQIFIRNAQSVLLEFIDSDKLVHYEAAILPNQTLGNKEEEVLLIKLNRECIADQQLQDGMELNVKIQFQLNRAPFCVKHFAIDELQNMDLVLPQVDGPQMLPPCPASVVGAEKTNAHQKQIIEFISKHGGSEAPPMPGVGPVLVYGPFGTGKTSTMAMAVTDILEKRPSCKILICTHSNSAADLYLRDNEKFSMIRMYATIRKTSSINPTVLKYVLKDENGNIRLPDEAEIHKCQVVVTTFTTAVHLVSAGLQGSFSHILVDEAGQVLEAEVLIALALATKDTCVVLTGDHIQMGPKIYSKQVRDAGLDSSLLQRLLLTKACKQKFLTSNYRTCQPILDFISKTFYKQNLKAGIEHLEHPHFKPMMFCEVKGVEHHLGTSYTNSHETLEVVRQVQLLMNGWPEQWGDFQDNVAVVAAYTMQVRQIESI